ncbi:MAG TPA: glycosyltransferase family 2 protein [Spirochaetota bacterium]|nr:glycosyltransferase family 2 protein [Spirochaetota bacterium]
MKISIALASYNGENFIREQLDSFCSQTRLPDELVISDDSSIDRTIAIINEFSRISPFPVKIIQNEKRLGITKNFENAIRPCTGDIIFLSDQDDVWLPEKIAVLADVLERNPDTGLVHCNADVVTEDLVSTGNSLWKSFWFSEREQEKVRNSKAFDVYLRHSVAAGMTMAFKSELLKAILPIPDIFSVHDVWVALVIAAVSQVRIIDRILVKYRVHGVNQTVGIHKLSLTEQFMIARKQARDETFPNLVALYENLEKRLYLLRNEYGFTITDYAMNNTSKRYNHARMRVNLSPNRFFRPFQILPGIAGGDYFRFSYGIKSIAQDLILR